MKKTLAILLTVLMAVMVFMPAVCANDQKEIGPTDEDIEITQEEIEKLEHVTSEGSVRADLISSYSLTLAKNGSQLVIVAKTIGISSVTKSGFTYIYLQRYVSGAWQNYATYTNQYNDGPTHSFSKAVNAATGYSYRVVCEHYAEKKTLLIFTSSQTIYNQTASLSF